MEKREFDSFAFISYSHRDMAVAKWLQRRLEGYRLPTEIHNEIDARSRYLRPIFRDQSDLDTGILNDELHRHLEKSKYLIIVCSRNSSQSEWVSAEARAFVEMGRLDRIIPLIVPDGTTSERELFPIFLRKYFAENPDKELLGVNIGEVGREKALIRVVSRMLSVSFDSLWRRHQRRKRLRVAVMSAAVSAILAAIYLFAIPVKVSVNVVLQESKLPVEPSVVLTVDGAEYTSEAAGHHFEDISVPGYKRFSDIAITARSQFFTPIDTVVPTGFGVKCDISITMRRDDSFAVYAGTVYDEEMNELEGVSVTVCGTTAVTDTKGHFSIILPLEEQRAVQHIALRKENYRSVGRGDEVPSRNLKYIMHPD